jgi:hypothetical protein
VHLLIPGWVYTVSSQLDDLTQGLTRAHNGEKPAGAVYPEECVSQLLQHVDSGEFYILCEDNDVKRQQDERRMQWNLDDVIHRREALSRWNSPFTTQYEEYMKQ